MNNKVYKQLLLCMVQNITEINIYQK